MADDGLADPSASISPMAWSIAALSVGSPLRIAGADS